MERGAFITFEGAEGSGKSTAMRRVGSRLEAAGLEVVYTREPGGCDLGRELRAILLDARNTTITPRAELFLYLADRAQHVAECVVPALERGAIVLSDRFADSTVVYQGYARGLDIETLHTLNGLAVNGFWPDLTLVFDVDAAVGLARANARNEAEGKSVSEGRFEAESLAFHEKVRQGFLDWASRHGDRMRILDASQNQDSVARQAEEAIMAHLPRLAGAFSR